MNKQSAVSNKQSAISSKLIFISLFTLIGLIALQIPINKLAGSKVSFTLFDLFAPISGAFLGTPIGVVSVFLMQGINILLHGVSNIDRGDIIRLFPILFGVWAFASPSSSFWRAKRIQNLKKADSGPDAALQTRALTGKQAKMTMQESVLLLVPIAAIISFNLNPVGRSVWYYSLFWTIPLALWPVREKFLIARSLSSTFTAHAAGGAIWIWAFNLPAAVWQGLIPVVAMERAIFALGISANYILFNNVLAYLSSKKLLPSGVNFSKKYLLK